MAVSLITTEEFKIFQESTNSKLDTITSLLETQSNFNRLVSKYELSEIIGCAESTIDNMRRGGLIEAIYVGSGEHGRPRFNPADVIKSLKNRKS